MVPVLLGPGETADSMLTSRAYGGLAKLLEALRAHDARVVEQLAEQQAQSRVRGVQSRNGTETGEEGSKSDRGGLERIKQRPGPLPHTLAFDEVRPARHPCHACSARRDETRALC
ncbi:hypothetical protein [Streptomyces agglomeratus]|uniref:hypothetical protein n=1 Tax=Streptomyces agglomeratus TaxID=285458 RepID=UPI000AD4A4BE